MSIWYDKEGKEYASRGKTSWIKFYAEYLTDKLRKEIEAEQKLHYSGKSGRHTAEDVDYDKDNTVKEAIRACADSALRNDKMLEEKISDSTWNVPDLVKFKGAIELDSDTYTTTKLITKNASLFDALESPLRGMYWYYVKAKTMDGYTQDSSGNWAQSTYYMPWGILIDVPYPFDGENIEQAEQKEGNPNVILSPVIDDGGSYTRLQRLELMTSPTSEKRRVFVRRLVRTPDILGNYGEPEWEEWKKADAELATKKYVDSKISAEKVSVVDSLADESSDKALSANQGKILNEKIASLAQATKSYTDEEIKKVNWNDSAVIEHKGTIDCTDVEYTGSDNPDLQQHYFSDNNILSAEACLKRLSELKFDAISEGAVADGKRYHYWVLLKLYPAEFSGSAVCEFIDDRAGIVANDGSYDSGHVRIFIINDNGIRHAFKQEYSFNYSETGIVYDWTDWERICIGENDIADSAITTEKLRNKSITTAKIADNAITADKLNDDIFSLAAEKAKAIPHTTAEGQSVKITDQLAGEEPISCKVYGASDGVGDLDSTTGKHAVPIRIFGKNMLKIISGYSTNGVNLTTTKIIKDSKGIIAIAKVVPNSKYTYTSSKSAYDERYFFFENNPIDTSEVAVGGVYGPFGKSRIITIPDNVNYIVFRVTADGVNITENLQLEEGETATQYEPYQTPQIITAMLDTPLSDGEYIDIVSKKRNDETDITISGSIILFDGTNNIMCQTAVQPSKISTEYYQDINKVITEIKNAVLSQGGNV